MKKNLYLELPTPVKKKNYKPLQVQQFHKNLTLFNSDILCNLVFKNTFLRHKKHKKNFSSNKQWLGWF